MALVATIVHKRSISRFGPRRESNRGYNFRGLMSIDSWDIFLLLKCRSVKIDIRIWQTMSGKSRFPGNSTWPSKKEKPMLHITNSLFHYNVERLKHVVTCTRLTLGMSRDEPRRGLRRDLMLPFASVWRWRWAWHDSPSLNLTSCDH